MHIKKVLLDLQQQTNNFKNMENVLDLISYSKVSELVTGSKYTIRKKHAKQENSGFNKKALKLLEIRLLEFIEDLKVLQEEKKQW